MPKIRCCCALEIPIVVADDVSAQAIIACAESISRATGSEILI
jgi:hypothetical protein